MPEDEIRVPAGLTTDGLLGRRYMARFIDSIVAGVLVVLFSAIIIGSVAGATGATVGGAMAKASVTALGLACWIAYGTLMEASEGQATIGKRVMRLKVYDANGGRLSLGQSAARNLVKDGPFLLFGIVAVAVGSNILSILWLVVHMVVMHRSPVYQAIHDRVAHTWVAAPEEVTQLRLS